MDAAQAAQAAAGRTDVGQGRYGDAVIVADHHAFDLAGTVDEQADLAVQFGGDGGQRAGRLPADDFIGLDPLLGQPLQIAQLLRLEPVGVTGDGGDGGLLGWV